ncbi:non-ribosomal peptide synthetase [Longimycelium tulufanense]|uniref:non-ribosomal peptide synthetase n=1 Tax=Longimycelium tulufanense TaxID=907463 RepID=UPI00166E8FE0|nr:non-ribosomal peptide synthetase [Longimycelium tulufanense]
MTDLLFRAAETCPHANVRHIADDNLDHSVVRTYPALVDEALHLLGGLRTRGLRPGDTVALLLERLQDFVPAFWACVLGGFVPCPLTPPTDSSELPARLDHLNGLLAGPLLVTTADLQRTLPATELVTASVAELSANARETTVHRARPEEVALLMLTSGSTGSAKAVRLTHHNLLASLRGKTGRLEVTARDVTLNWVPFDHIAAVEFHLMPLYAGAPQIQVEPQVILGDPLRLLRLVDTHRVTMTFAPNFLLAQIVKAVARGGHRPVELSSLRHLISGGEAVVCATARDFLDRLARFGLARNALVPAFGMTETCAGSVFSTQFPDVDAGLEFASLGLPIAGLQMRIVDDNDVPLADGEAGDLQVRGPMVFDGYLDNDEANRAAFTTDSWFRTGDRGEIHDGRLSLVGRGKDSIIVNGVSYYSHDLETVLERMEGVEASSVAAFPTRRRHGDTEQLVVVFSPRAPFRDDTALRRLLSAIRDRVVLHWGFRPALVLPLPSSTIPRTSLGKIQRSRLRQWLEAGDLARHVDRVGALLQGRPDDHRAPDTETEVVLADVYAEVFGLEPGAVSATANFLDLGGTSLEILRLKRRVEQRFGMRDLPMSWLLRAPTVQDLAGHLDAHPTAQDYDPLVPLQRSGHKTPLFCVHPGVGEVLVFVNLATCFANERPFYALRARGFGAGESYFSSFAEMVDCYVRAIRAEQPTGPYAVAGYSYGGVVAFEIAKELEATGERVAFLGILNIPPRIRHRMHELDFTEGAVNLAFFLSLVSREQAAELPRQLRDGLSRQEQLKHLLELAPQRRLNELDLDPDKFAAWVEVAQSLVRLGRTYEPSGTVRSASVFYAEPLRGTKQEWLDTQIREWDTFARQPNRYIEVPGEHYTLMGTRHLATFHDILRKELDLVLGED